ncbi:MAG: prepilin-type N-terminal cleavage/methylation domain-containing protein [Sedimentisphaerales bacterium]|nr:prepilin-type N-terminal cleavage/methylation domain-containing protein [Sedimentisphaerales bacterium]
MIRDRFNKKCYFRRFEVRAFTLIEILTVLTIASLVMIAAVEVYSRVRDTSSKIHRRLGRDLLPAEILQRIAEDLDRVAMPGFDTRVMMLNKMDNGYNVSQLTIESNYFGNTNRSETYEKVIWQTNYNPFNDKLFLYRSHQGLQLEDPVLDTDLSGQPRQDVDRFVEVADNLTYIEILIPNGENYINSWTKSKPPNAVTISISTADPVQNEMGELIIPEGEIFTRTVAIDRTRVIPFKFVKKDFDMEDLDSNDPNDLSFSEESETESETDEPSIEEENTIPENDRASLETDRSP